MLQNRFRGFEAPWAEIDPPPLNWSIAVTTVYALACYTAIKECLDVNAFYAMTPNRHVLLIFADTLTHPGDSGIAGTPQAARNPTSKLRHIQQRQENILA